MQDEEQIAIRRQGPSGKWLVVLIIGGGTILAVVGAKYTKYKTTTPEPTTNPSPNIPDDRPNAAEGIFS